MFHPSQELGTPSEKIWPGYNELPIVKKTSFSSYPYNSLRKRFGATDISEKGFDLLNRSVGLSVVDTLWWIMT